MKKIIYNEEWPQSWKYSYPYDLLEIYGEEYRDLGYSYAYQNRKLNTLKLLSEIGKIGDEVLDVAAAQGNFTISMAQLGYKVTWNDIRSDLIEYVKMKSANKNITFAPGDVFKIKFESLFDIIVATEIIEHVAHPDNFLAKLGDLLKPGGHIIFSTPLGSYFKNKLPKFTEFDEPSQFESRQFGPNSEDHIFLLHIDEISILAERANFEIVAIKYYTNSLTNGHLKLSSILKYMPKRMVLFIESITQNLPLFIGKRIHTNFVCLLRKKA